MKDPKDDKFLDLGTVRFKKINRTTVAVNGIYTVKRRFDDTVKGRVEAYNMQGGEYRKYAERNVDKPCTNLAEKAAEPWDHFLKHTNISECPVEPVNIFFE
jgi:hypothetical protein